MKLNFELCKICKTRGYFWLSYKRDGEKFYNHQLIYCCICTFYFKKGLTSLFESDEPKATQFRNGVGIDYVTTDDLNEIKKMDIIKVNEEKYFNRCPYRLEQLVEF